MIVFGVYSGLLGQPCARHDRPNPLSRLRRSPLGRPCVLAGLDGPHRSWRLHFQSLRSLQRHCVPRGPAASRPSAERTRDSGNGFAIASSLGFSSRFVLRPKRPEPRAQGSPQRMAAKRRAGASPPKPDRALGRPLGSVRPTPVANVAPIIALRCWSRRRCRFCCGRRPYSPHPGSAPPDPSPWAREVRAGRPAPGFAGPPRAVAALTLRLYRIMRLVLSGIAIYKMPFRVARIAMLNKWGRICGGVSINVFGRRTCVVMSGEVV